MFESKNSFSFKWLRKAWSPVGFSHHREHLMQSCFEEECRKYCIPEHSMNQRTKGVYTLIAPTLFFPVLGPKVFLPGFFQGYNLSTCLDYVWISAPSLCHFLSCFFYFSLSFSLTFCCNIQASHSPRNSLFQVVPHTFGIEIQLILEENFYCFIRKLSCRFQFSVIVIRLKNVSSK